MTLWLCDRCGKLVRKDSNKAGKYEISMNCVEEDEWFMVRNYTRSIKLCDRCASDIEKLLDNEFSKIPKTISFEVNKER